MLQIEVYKSTVNGFRFLLTTDGNRCVLRSLPFVDLVSCMEGVEAFRRNIDSDSCFEIWRTHRGDSFFNYFDEEGAILATSDVHDSIESLLEVMNVIREQARTAPCRQHGQRNHTKRAA